MCFVALSLHSSFRSRIEVSTNLNTIVQLFESDVVTSVLRATCWEVIPHDTEVSSSSIALHQCVSRTRMTYCSPGHSHTTSHKHPQPCLSPYLCICKQPKISPVTQCHSDAHEHLAPPPQRLTRCEKPTIISTISCVSPPTITTSASPTIYS